MSILVSELYLRQAEVIVGTRIDRPTPIEPQDALSFKTRILFNVEKTSEANSNKAKVTLYNLSQQSRSFLEQESLILFLKAGYRDAVSTIFIGDVVRLESKRQGPDVTTIIDCGDAENKLKEAHIEIGLGPNATNRQAFNLAVQTLNLTLGATAGIETRVYKNGFSFSGTIKELLNNLTKQINLEWSIQDGEIMILPKDKTDGQEAVLITPETGLIGFPTKTPQGIDFVSLLNPQIRPGRAIRIQSKQFHGVLTEKGKTIASSALDEAGGVVKCQRVVFAGDTDEGTWQAKVETIIPEQGLEALAQHSIAISGGLG